MSRKLKWILSILVVLIILYWIGPKPESPAWSLDFPSVPLDPDKLESFISAKEALHKLKPDNEARIIWADSTKAKTQYSVIYLHGFSASQEEGDPIHLDFAREFGCNLYLARLADHGIDTTETLLTFTSDRWWSSAKEALAIGKAIGENVIVMSTSTGGTMALVLAAEFPEDVCALINMSPNIAINNPAAFLLNGPWGLQIARLVMDGKYREWEASAERRKYWNTKYRLEATVQLEEMIESRMNASTFNKVTQPCLTLYYYKDEEHQDPEVKVSAMLKMMDQISTPPEKKRSVAIPEAGAHVLGSSLVSHDVPNVYREIEKFAIDVLHLQPKVNLEFQE